MKNETPLRIWTEASVGVERRIILADRRSLPRCADGLERRWGLSAPVMSLGNEYFRLVKRESARLHLAHHGLHHFQLCSTAAWIERIRV